MLKIPFYIEIYFISGASRKLITRLATQRWLDVSQDWTQDIHKTNHTAFSYAIRVRCLDNYYGDSCEKLCRPRNDKFGHYTCSPTGDKVCLRGWTGEYCSIGKVFDFLLKIKKISKYFLSFLKKIKLN